MNKLIVISAPSGAGKTTLCRRLLQEFPELKLSISTTTRAPRGSEKEGQDYFFTTPDHFEAQIKAGAFAEWAKVHGNYYGTSRKFVEDTFAQGKSVLLDIDVQGAESLRRAFPAQCYSVFIAPPSFEALANRLRTRGTDSAAEIQKRLTAAKLELQEASKFSAIVVNDQIDSAYAELSAMVRSQLGLGAA
jgi:guanylate kinase